MNSKFIDDFENDERNLRKCDIVLFFVNSIMWIVEFESNIFTKLQLDNFGGVWRVFGHLIHKEVGLGYMTKYVTSHPTLSVPRKKINKRRWYG